MVIAPPKSPRPQAVDHGRRRYRQAALTSAVALLAKAAGMASTLLTIPITAPYLGAERFGLFMTIGAIPLVLSFSDFGIGNGLLTELATAHGREDRDRARVLVSSAFFVLLAIACLMSIVLLPLIPLLPWASILNLHSPAAIAEAPASIAVFAALTLAGVPVGLPQRIQQGFQRGYVANAWLLAGNVLTLVLLPCFVFLRKSLPWLVFAVAGATLLAGALNWHFEFKGDRRWLRPSWRSVRIGEAVQVARAGLLIFSSQVGGALLLSLPVLILARRFGPDTVAPYAVIQRILSAFVVAAGLVVTPLWPAYGEALARHDHDWIRRTFWRSIVATLAIAGTPLLVANLLGPHLVRFFSANAVVSDQRMPLAVAVLCCCIAIRHSISMMVNGCGYLRRTAAGFPVAVVFAIAALFVPALTPFAVPLWVAGAEVIVIAVLLSDASRILAKGRAA